MALFAVGLILSARFKFLDRLWGLNRVYIHHHRFGAIAFILLLLHPVFLLVRYLTISLDSAFTFLTSYNLAIIFGKLSLLGMIILLVLTFFVSLRYDFWKKTHKYLGLAFFFGGLHALFITSDISNNMVLRWYLLTLAALAIFVYIYYTLLGRVVGKRYLYSVKAVNKLSEAIAEIILTPVSADKKISYQAGQFAFINFNDQKIGLEQHPYSFASAPEEETIKFVVKNLGDYTGKLPQLAKGTVAKIEGPYGQFSFINCSSKKQIWIAGGIGATPFVSLGLALKSSVEAGNYEIDLYYCVKDKTELVLINRLKEIAANLPKFRVIPFCSDERGRITAQVVSEESHGLAKKDILICGPALMMTSLKKKFIELGVKKNNIHSEEFNL